MMTVWLFSIVRNEAPLLPYFIRHYAPWVSKFIFYDGGSDDGTRDIIRSCHTAELRDWPGTNALADDEFLAFANEQWKEARGQADWIAWCDADEFLYAPNILDVLARYLREGIELPLVAGFTMVSKIFPTTTGQIYDEVRTGLPDAPWSKPVIFRNAMRWTVGRHGVDVNFKPRRSATAEIKLLHYRALGMDYVRARHARNWARVPDRCRRLSLGANCNPDYEGAYSLAWFEEQISKELPTVI